MRKAIQSLIVAVVLLGSIGLAKGGDPFVKVAKKGSKEFFLFMDTVSITEEKSTISLKDLSGGVIYTEQIRSEEPTSELQSPVPISYAVFCLKKKKNKIITSTL